jgi:MFS family permease
VTTTSAGTARDFLRRHSIDTRPLRHPPYRRVFIGNAVSNFGFQFTAVAVQVQMYALTHSSGYVGLLGLASLIPLVVFGVWGGAISDTVDRRRLLLASSLLLWCSTLGLLLQALLGLHQPWLLFVLMAVQATAFSVSAPTRNAILPRLVPAPEIPSANTLNTTTFNAALVLGPILGGLIVHNGEDRYVVWAYLVDAVAFLAALWATWRLPSIPPQSRASRSDGSPGRVAGWPEIRAGFAFIAASPVLWLSFAIDIAAMVLALPRSLFPQVAAQQFGAGSIGFLYAAIGIGSVVAGLTSGWIRRVHRQGVALVISVVVWGLAVGAAGLAGSLWLAVLLLAVGGAADLVSAVYRQSILQTYAPDGLQGRMQGIFIAVVAGGPRLGDLRAGFTAAVIGPTVAWAGGGIAAAVVAAGLALAFPALLRYTPPPRTDGATVDATEVVADGAIDLSAGPAPSVPTAPG